MPKVSVIVPVHNTASFLRGCVRSILEQSLSDLEIILVENASTDNSLVLCHELAAEDERIKVMSIAVGDLSSARNAGIALAQAEYVAFVDSDDTIGKDMYRDMYGFAVENDLDIVFCNFLNRYRWRKDKIRYSSDGSHTVMSPKELLELNFTEKIPHSACTLMCRKALFDNISFPEFRYFEDTGTTYRLIAASSRGGYIATPHYIYYRHGGSIVHKMNFAKSYGHLQSDMERIEFIRTSGLFEDSCRDRLAQKSVAAFFRFFAKMVKMASTPEQKDICRRLRMKAGEYDGNYVMKKRYARIRSMVQNHWKLFCILKRGEVL